MTFRETLRVMLRRTSYDILHARECEDYRAMDLCAAERDMLVRIIAIYDANHRKLQAPKSS